MSKFTGPYLTARELQEEGYLMEVNRRFFHPLGLALAVDPDVDNDDQGRMGDVRVWDLRDDPEGMLFADLSDDDAIRKSSAVALRFAHYREARQRALGDDAMPSSDSNAVVQRIGSDLRRPIIPGSEGGDVSNG